MPNSTGIISLIITFDPFHCQNPDFNTYIPLDHLLMGFIQEETGYNPSFDVNGFLTNLFTYLQTPVTDPYTVLSYNINAESNQFFAQLQQPINATHWITYDIDQWDDGTGIYHLRLFENGNFQQQVCDQWWNDGRQLYCVNYWLRTSTYTI